MNKASRNWTGFSLFSGPKLWMAFVALSVLAMVVCWLFSFSTSFVFAREGRPAGGCDFTMRYNEIRCVLDRIDPFAITRGDVTHPVYVRFNRWEPGKMNLTGYTPWTYAFLLPFAVLPKALAAAAYTLLELGCILFLFRFSYCHAKRTGLPEKNAIAVSASLCLLVYPITSAFGTGNFGIPFAATIALMAVFLNNGNGACAGLCWAFLMCKPQIGILFAVPILLHRKWKTLEVAAVVCLSATFAVAAWLRESPVALLLEVVRDGDVGYYATDFLPRILFRSATSCIPKTVILLFHGILGLLLCLFCSWRTRASALWTVRLAPATMFASVWTYSWPHDKCIYAIIVAIAMTIWFRTDLNRWRRRYSLALAILCGSSFLLAFVKGGALHPLFSNPFFQKSNSIPIPFELTYAFCSVAKTVLASILFLFWKDPPDTETPDKG